MKQKGAPRDLRERVLGNPWGEPLGNARRVRLFEWSERKC